MEVESGGTKQVLSRWQEMQEGLLLTAVVLELRSIKQSIHGWREQHRRCSDVLIRHVWRAGGDTESRVHLWRGRIQLFDCGELLFHVRKLARTEELVL